VVKIPSAGPADKAIHIQNVPAVKVNISEFNSRADAELKTSYTHGSNW
jgi:hypothetical protein